MAVFRHKKGKLSTSKLKFKGFLESNWCSKVMRTLCLAFTTPKKAPACHKVSQWVRYRWD